MIKKEDLKKDSLYMWRDVSNGRRLYKVRYSGVVENDRAICVAKVGKMYRKKMQCDLQNMMEIERYG